MASINTFYIQSLIVCSLSYHWTFGKNCKGKEIRRAAETHFTFLPTTAPVMQGSLAIWGPCELGGNGVGRHNAWGLVVG